MNAASPDAGAVDGVAASAPAPGVRGRTSTSPAVGALVVAALGLLPALLVLVWPAGGFLWLGFVAVAAGVMAVVRGRLPGPQAFEVERELEDRLHIGVDAEVALVMRNRSGRRIRVQVRDAPPQVLGDGELGDPLWLDPGEERRFTYTVRPCDRGSYAWDEAWVRWWSSGRVWTRRHRYALRSVVAVWPDIRALTDVSELMIRKLYSELGVKEQRRRGRGTEFDHIKEHTPDDGTTGIDWKATARRHKPMVRMYRVEQNHDVVIGIDTGRLMGSRVEGITKLDHAINATLLLGRVCLVNGDRPGILTFDSRVRSFVKPASDRGQMERLLHGLHDLRSDFSETSVRRALVYLDSYQRKRSLVILLTDFVHGQADESLVASVLGIARRHLVLFVALRDPLLDEMATAMPERVEDAFAKVVTQGLEEDRRVVLRTLSQRGVRTLDLQPTQITQRVINRYLQMRQGI